MRLQRRELGVMERLLRTGVELKAMRLVIALFVVVVSRSAAFIGPAEAEIVITVDKSAQHMTVARDGEQLYDWPVSTGRSGYATPSGSYTAFRMEEDHYSKEWDDAPMPYSIFFTKIGHAIHGSLETKKLGMPASHGCVRLSPENAATLFALVKQEGVFKTRVALIGSEQVALARRSVGTIRNRNDAAELRSSRPLDSSVEYEPEYTSHNINPNARKPEWDDAQPRYANPNAGYRSQDYAQERRSKPNYRYAEPRYDRPYYVRPQYREPPYWYRRGYDVEYEDGYD
jgi:hypothetical protein